MAEGKRLRITLVSSVIGQRPRQKATVKALGLKKRGSTVEKEAHPAVVGMVQSVKHLIAVEEIG